MPDLLFCLGTPRKLAVPSRWASQQASASLLCLGILLKYPALFCIWMLKGTFTLDRGRSRMWAAAATSGPRLATPASHRTPPLE